MRKYFMIIDFWIGTNIIGIPVFHTHKFELGIKPIEYTFLNPKKEKFKPNKYGHITHYSK